LDISTLQKPDIPTLQLQSNYTECLLSDLSGFQGFFKIIFFWHIFIDDFYLDLSRERINACASEQTHLGIPPGLGCGVEETVRRDLS
jgi:hypothetical protein